MIYIASDHAGFELKNTIISHLKEQGLEVEDAGPFAYDPDDDYPDFIYPCAVKVAAGDGSMGVVIGGSGQGEAIVANKVRGVRAAVYQGGDLEIVKKAREHNNANVLSLGARFVESELALQAVDLWLKTDFTTEVRHQRRIEKINKIESQTLK